MIKVVTAIIERDGKILLQRRARHREFGGLFETPGGKVDLNETDQQALERELREELGLSNAIVSDIPLFTATFEPPLCRQPYTLLAYPVIVAKLSRISVNEDATDVGFYYMSELLDSECVPSLKLYRTYKSTVEGN